MVRPIVAVLGQARRHRSARGLQTLVDAQARVPSLVPANALLLRDRGLEPIEQLLGSRSRLAALEIDDVHRQFLSLADPHAVRAADAGPRPSAQMLRDPRLTARAS